MIKVVGYCRFSSENQSDGFSIEAQKNAIKEFCQKEKYEIIRFYIDEAKTGTTTDGRVQFLEMLDDSRKKEFSHVIVHKLDRFARSRADSAVCKKILKDNGVSVISVLEPLDDSPESIILESVLEGMNEYYSKNLSRETKKGMRVAISKGRILGSLPYGIIADKDNKFAVDEEQAKVVKYIFNEFGNGVKMTTLVRLLKDQGYKTKAGNDFTAGTLTNMIKNPLYTGDYKFGDNLYPNVVAPIVSRELFAKCQNNFRHYTHSKDKGTIYLLTGILFHECGAPMIGYKSIKKGKEYYFYRCKNKEPGAFIKKKEMEDGIIKCLIDFLSKDKVINDLTKSINKQIKESNEHSDVAQIKKKLDELKTQDKKLLDLYLNGILDKELYTSKKAELDIETNILQTKLQTCLIPAKITAPVLKAAFKYYLYQIKNGLTETNSMQAIISTFIKKVVLFREHFEVTFNFGDSSVAFKRDYAPASFTLVATYKYTCVDNLKVLYQSSKFLNCSY